MQAVLALRAFQSARPQLVIFALCGLIGACQRSPTTALDSIHGQDRGLDVVLITLDTTRADHLGCYGRTPSYTPVMDRLCAEGIRFDNAVTPAPVTLPAHTSIMTGLLPNHHGVRYNGESKLAGEVPVLADELGHAGYRTAAFVSSFVLDARFGIGRGFQTYDDHVEPMTVRNGIVSRNERDADSVTDAALQYLDHRDMKQPLFLWVHYYDAHAPYVSHHAAATSDDDAAYSGQIADIDDALARLLASPKLNIDNTIVVIAADHGEGLGEHGERTHGLFLYESTVHVPLIIRLPKARAAGRTDSDLAALIDIRPTLLDLLGIQPSGPSDGIALTTARRTARDFVYQESALPYFDFGFSPLYALRQAKAKFIEAPEPEYYDLAVDPREEFNLLADRSGKKPENADYLRGKLDAFMLTTLDIPTAAAAAQPTDADTLARLRSLGYVGEGTATSGGPLADPKSRVDIVNLHQEAVRAIDAGHPAQALALLNIANERAPGNQSLLRLKSKAELQLGKIDDAERTLVELLGIRRNPDSLVLLAQIKVLHDDFDGAELLLKEAEKLDPRHGGVPIARGDIASRRGDRQSAERFYRQAQAIDPIRVGPIAEGRLRKLQAGAGK